MEKEPCALTIAGSDSSGGAGLQADLKTFSALRVYGATAVTAVTAQNTLGVSAIHLIPADIVAAQIEAVFSDLSIKAVKTGMLGSDDIIETTAGCLRKHAAALPIIVDPVMVSTSGHRLLEPQAQSVLVERLFPLATLITPNLPEAAVLLKADVARNEADMKGQAERLLDLGPSAVLIKGGHGSGHEAADWLYDGHRFHRYAMPRIATKNTHGTGCTLASAITAFLVKGVPLEGAVESAKAYLHAALERAAFKVIGAGSGPLSHFPDDVR